MSFQTSRDLITGIIITYLTLEIDKGLLLKEFPFPGGSFLLAFIVMGYIIWDFVEYRKERILNLKRTGEEK